MQEERKAVDVEELLLRRSFLPEKKFSNPDGSATSRVFKLREKDNGELSVDVKSLTTIQKTIGDPTRFFIFELHNVYVHSIEKPKLNTLYDPLSDGSNNAHSVIVGMSIDDDITPGLLARASRKVMMF